MYKLSQSMSADTRVPDHSIFVWINQLCCISVWFSLLCFHFRSNCTNMAQWSIEFFFFFLTSTNQIVCIIIRFKRRNSLSGWENHQTTSYYATEDKGVQKCLDFLWHRHEDNIDTGNYSVSMWPSFCRLCCSRTETGVVNRNFII